jgi:hypothetical protein
MKVFIVAERLTTYSVPTTHTHTITWEWKDVHSVGYRSQLAISIVLVAPSGLLSMWKSEYFKPRKYQMMTKWIQSVKGHYTFRMRGSMTFLTKHKANIDPRCRFVPRSPSVGSIHTQSCRIVDTPINRKL